MSQGSDSSGEDLVAGRTNRAEERTVIWADVAPGGPNYNGPAIFMVEVAGDRGNSEWDKSDYEDNESFIPSNQFNGIMATAWSGGAGPENPGGSPGGTGVIGRGGFNQGTGVQGLGGGTPIIDGRGAGGIGVHGIGGSQSEFPFFWDQNVAPGAGLVGQGGRQSQKSNISRLPHGPGVIGIGGGTGLGFDALPSHTLMQTGGVGVYGQGAELTTSMEFPPQVVGQPPPTVKVPSGPPAPGVGVVGRGGVAAAPSSEIAAGVVGLAGGVAIPSASTTNGAGVFGQGNLGLRGIGSVVGVEGISPSSIGVQGSTDSGTGVIGVATKSGRGGMFGSADSAQLQLLPHSSKVTKPDSKLSTPLELIGTGIPRALPKAGLNGDLLTINILTKAAIDTPEIKTCTLWLCVRSADQKTSTPAVWSQILLGGLVSGQIGQI
jgi:hypothetical protein